MDGGADVMGGGGQGVQELRVPRPRLALTSPPEVAASGDGEADQHHGKDGR